MGHISPLKIFTRKMGAPCTWGIDAIKIFSELVGGFVVIPMLHFFEIFKHFSFLGLSRGPFEIR